MGINIKFEKISAIINLKEINLPLNLKRDLRKHENISSVNNIEIAGSNDFVKFGIYNPSKAANTSDNR